MLKINFHGLLHDGKAGTNPFRKAFRNLTQWLLPVVTLCSTLFYFKTTQLNNRKHFKTIAEIV